LGKREKDSRKVRNIQLGGLGFRPQHTSTRRGKTLLGEHGHAEEGLKETKAPKGGPQKDAGSEEYKGRIRWADELERERGSPGCRHDALTRKKQNERE